MTSQPSSEQLPADPPAVAPPAFRDEPLAVGSSADLVRPRARNVAAVVIGSSMFVVGFVAILVASLTSLVSIIVLALVLIGAGLFEIAAAMTHRHGPSIVGRVLAGLLSVALGAWLIAEPLLGLDALTLMLVGYLVAGAFVRIAFALYRRRAGWGWSLVFAFVSVLLAIMVLASYPLSALWLVGTIVGVELMIRGIELAYADVWPSLRARAEHPPAR
ncbi:MAG TPA: DUF308 domain-containing protein [Kofleriaceae bacterium]|jgi:uncharacterized membrane protein HdeD (DUF308 family)|nr:DUF308 domain-containing protein [Kofleriaceae bacterium]